MSVFEDDPRQVAERARAGLPIALGEFLEASALSLTAEEWRQHGVALWHGARLYRDCQNGICVAAIPAFRSGCPGVLASVRREAGPLIVRYGPCPRAAAKTREAAAAAEALKPSRRSGRIGKEQGA